MTTRRPPSLTARSRKASEDDLSDILAHAAHKGPAAVMVTDANGVIVYVNPRFTALTGYAARDVLGRPASLLKSGEMPQADYQALWRHLRRGDTWSGEFSNRKKNGALYWEQASISSVSDGRGRLCYYLKIAVDITAQKRLETDLRQSVQALRHSQAQLERQSHHDALTGLLNRRGFQVELCRLRSLAERQGASIGFLVIDIDHFKQINDRYGHAVGDRTLKAFAQLLKGRLRAADLVCRYGGDELVIALPDSDAAATQRTGLRILSAVRRHDFSAVRRGLAVTVSIGAACGAPGAGQTPDQTIKRADRALYRVKRGTRNDIAFDTGVDASERLACETGGRPDSTPGLDLLLSALRARDPATAAHGQRVSRLAGALAHALKLPAGQAARLVQAALLHDVGKLAVPDAILLKPGDLTAAERARIQRHAQAGYAIVKNGPGLGGLAEIVRDHHERLDGSGYPRGLKGERIGLATRILAVADTYDAICAGRPYSTARSTRDALAELRRCRDTLFDAAVVNALPRALKRLGATVLSVPDARSPRGRAPSARATRA